MKRTKMTAKVNHEKYRNQFIKFSKDKTAKKQKMTKTKGVSIMKRRNDK